MKLAEALQRRADLNRKIDELRRRLVQNALTQEGEKPAEDPTDLLDQYDTAIEEYGRLIAQINLTNSRTVRDGMTLTQLIARKDALNVRLQGYRDIANEASQGAHRARATEIRVLPTVDVAALRREADGMAKEIRRLDNLLQETNWTTELEE